MNICKDNNNKEPDNNTYLNHNPSYFLLRQPMNTKIQSQTKVTNR